MEDFAHKQIGRIDAAQTARILGFSEHDIPILVNVALLKPLGKPARNAIKYFAATDVMEKAKDPVWLGKATQAVSAHWQKKNARRQKGSRLPCNADKTSA